jgi:flagellar hook-associated protein 2
MSTLAAAGIGSGLDIEGIIQSLMAVEQIPLQKLQAQSGDYLAQISAYGQLRSSVSTFQSSISKLSSFDGFTTVKATSADSSVFSAGATDTAAENSYDIQVDFLAQAQKMGSAVQADSDTTTIGNAGDQLSISITGNDFTVEVGGKTLTEIKDAINQKTDNVGVSASIIQEDENSFYLSLTSDETGLDNMMTLSFTDSGGGAIADPLGFVETQEALNAQITIDNTYTVSRSTNTISNAIEGVTLELKATSTEPVALNVERSTSSISSAVAGFVTAYNELRSSLGSLGQNELQGDGTLRLIENQVRSLIGSKSNADGAFAYASQVGISFEKDGSLSLDSDKLSNALETDPNSVEELFANDDQGFAFRLDAMLEGMLSSNGLIDAREDGLNARVDDTNENIDSLMERLERTEARYRSQFTSLDVLLGQMQSTSEYVTAQLSALDNLMTTIANKK